MEVVFHCGLQKKIPGCMRDEYDDHLWRIAAEGIFLRFSSIDNPGSYPYKSEFGNPDH